jgi:hypothetical protein
MVSSEGSNPEPGSAARPLGAADIRFRWAHGRWLRNVSGSLSRTGRFHADVLLVETWNGIRVGLFDLPTVERYF